MENLIKCAERLVDTRRICSYIAMFGHQLLSPVDQTQPFVEFQIGLAQYYWTVAIISLAAVGAFGLIIWLLISKRRIEEQLRQTKVQLENKVSARTLELEALNRELQQLSVSDALTGIANRRSFDNYLQLEWAKAVRSGKTLAMIMVDIDFFKAYNDTYGHQSGDACVTKVAAILQSGVRRASDLAARYGGEEFAIILPETNTAGAMLLAENLRLSVEQLALEHHRSVYKIVTISLGVAAVAPQLGQPPSMLISRADQALYEAKRQGRNQVKLWVAGSS
ncbi:diguanylate cyclase|uniref:Diguanylate cyclase (GGDEF) domain-containing protein n=1 Tax=Dendrosporobacter quercicolus TaxID=146817 RepID=A0A1G9QEJ9_9FIRM|nr:diguanylate cyclase [Dendrosporobacter quercicolus]NSL48216.1 diguanylate cyclase [Dendrosporobacter quercicolus DSM 1736]SDM09403.1 diguanylate cyclase (GGDEF) domain-containing protein [Dendrosporobacter quercicolus]